MLNLAKRVNHWVWDPNEERKRLESWHQEQERLLQVHRWNAVYLHGPQDVEDMSYIYLYMYAIVGVLYVCLGFFCVCSIKYV